MFMSSRLILPHYQVIHADEVLSINGPYLLAVSMLGNVPDENEKSWQPSK